MIDLANGIGATIIAGALSITGSGLYKMADDVGQSVDKTNKLGIVVATHTEKFESLNKRFNRVESRFDEVDQSLQVITLHLMNSK